MVVFVPDICVYVKEIGILHAPETQTQMQTLDVNRPLAMKPMCSFSAQCE